MLTLYFAPGASSLPRISRCMRSGCPSRAKPMSFKQERHAQPRFLALNPEGKVPTLVVDGRPLTEVAAILFYLARRFPDAGLLPRWRYRGRGAGGVLDVLHCLDAASGAAARAGPCQTGLWHRRPAPWAMAGRSAAIRSPTSICSGCIGGSPMRFIPRPGTFPNLDRALRADDGPAGGAAHDRGRNGGRVRIAGVSGFQTPVEITFKTL